jgi:purine catabolism regulator
MLTVRQVLAMELFANSQLVAGTGGLDREVRWAHVVDIPQPGDWVRAGELLLTTFYGLRENPAAQAQLCAQLAEKGLAGMIVAVGQYLDHVPPAISQAADAADFPVVELPWAVPFEDVVRAVSEHIINEQYELYKQSLAIHRSLTQLVLDGGSLQDVASALCALLGRPVEIDNLAFAVLAEASGPDRAVDESRRTAIREGRSSPELIDYLRKSGTLARVRSTLAPERIDVDPQTIRHGMTMARILAPIVVARKIYGYVWIIAGGRALEPLDFHAIEHAATVAALILLRDQTTHQAEERAENRILGQLLADEVRLDNTLREEAARFRLRLEAAHAVIVADPGPNDLRALELAARSALRQAALPAAVGERAGRVVVLLECQRPQAPHDFCRRMAAEVRLLEPPVRIGASPVQPSSATLRRAYEQALEAVMLMPALGGDRQVAHFEELGLLHWLYALPADMLAENAYARWVQSLAESDRTRGSDLLHTLEVFLECDGNGVRAAERLFVHRHTLKYRLHRIEEICGVDLSDPFCKLNLRTALLSRRMRNGHHSE